LAQVQEALIVFWMMDGKQVSGAFKDEFRAGSAVHEAAGAGGGAAAVTQEILQTAWESPPNIRPGQRWSCPRHSGQQ
jgi:hypothetical protein